MQQLLQIKTNLIFILFIISLLCYCSKTENKEEHIDILTGSNKNINILKDYLQEMDSLYTGRQADINTINFQNYTDNYFAEGTPFTILSNGNYILSSSYPSVFVAIYQKDGSHIKNIYREGRGPGEYLYPSYIKSRNDTIFLFDRQQLKTNLYNSNGAYINSIASLELYPKDFEISPISNQAIFYYIFSNPESPVLSVQNFNTGVNNSFGRMQIKNLASARYSINGISINEKGLVFVIYPQEYGFAVFSLSGEFVGRYTREIPEYYKPAPENDLRLRDYVDNTKLREQYFKYSRSRYIHYLGEDILLIQIENPKPNPEDEKQAFPLYLEFWKTDGSFLGSLRTKHRIYQASNGKLYYWHSYYERNTEGIYPNPSLIVFDLWKTIGWRD